MKTCKVTNRLFYLEVDLFSDLRVKKSESLDVQGASIYLEKKVLRELARELQLHEHRELQLPVKDREYQIKLSFSRNGRFYKIMDNERTNVLGAIEVITVDSFLNA